MDILLVEDNPGDIRLAQETFREINQTTVLHVVTDGADAMAFLRREGEYANAPRPDMILLDLNLPKLGGQQVLAKVKADECLKTIPTVILTTSSEDIEQCYQLGANCYLKKPVELGSFNRLVASLDTFWGNWASLPQQMVPVAVSDMPVGSPTAAP